MKKEIAIKTINDVLSELNMTPYELSKKLGMNRPQGLYDVLNPDKKVGVSKNLAEKICSIFPQFNYSWLLTGEGEMLNNEVIVEHSDGHFMFSFPPHSKSIYIGTRLSLFIEHLGISQGEFAKSIGMSEKYMSRLIQENKSMSTLAFSWIIETYPQINPNWLLTGEGSMLKNTNENTVSEPQAAYGSDIANLKRKIEMLESEIKDLKEQREVLKEIIEMQKGSISDKDFIIDLLNEKVSAPVSVKAKSTLK